MAHQPLLRLPRLPVGFLGGGPMATALSLAIVKSDVLRNNSSVITSDPYQSQLTHITNTFNAL
eukprot:UN03928